MNIGIALFINEIIEHLWTFTCYSFSNQTRCDTNDTKNPITGSTSITRMWQLYYSNHIGNSKYHGAMENVHRISKYEEETSQQKPFSLTKSS